MKTININGIEYVQKEELDKLKKSMNKEYVKKSDLTKIKANLIEINKLIDNNKKTEYKVGRPKDDVIFKPSKSLKNNKLEIIGLTRDGHFVKHSGHATPYTVEDVKFLKSMLTKQTTYKQIRNYAKTLHIRPDTCRIIAYNIDKGTFEKYL